MTDYSELPAVDRNGWAPPITIGVTAVGAAVLGVWLTSKPLHGVGWVVFGWISVAMAVLVALSVLVLGRLVARTGRKEESTATAIWVSGPGLVSYFSDRADDHDWMATRVASGGALIATRDGLTLGGYSWPHGITWEWEDIDAIRIGPVLLTTVSRRTGLILHVRSGGDDDVVPVWVNPSLYPPFSKRRAVLAFANRLDAMRRNYSEDAVDPSQGGEVNS